MQFAGRVVGFLPWISTKKASPNLERAIRTHNLQSLVCDPNVCVRLVP